MELVSDLSLLENAARCSSENQSASGPIKLHSHRERKNAPPTKAFEALQRACWRRNKCKLLALPSHFTRHVKNSSQFNCKEDLISWNITWVLPHHVKKVIQSPHVSERSRLSHLVTDILKKIDKDLTDPDEISVYKSAPFQDLKVLLKCEFMKDEGFNSRFIEMQTQKSLVWNLQECILVEHPIIVLVHKDHSNFYLQDLEGQSITEMLQNETNQSQTDEEDKAFAALDFYCSGNNDQDQEMETNHSSKKSMLATLVAYPSSEDEN